MKEIVEDNQMGDSATAAVTCESRSEAAKLHNVGKHEPKLTENGIPADVLEKLLPGNDIVELEKPVVNGGLFYRFIKRSFDVVSCGCALIVLAIPMAVIAVKIKTESEGPVIYAQRRVGKDGKVFSIYKFRSMYTDAESRGAQWAQDEDPRVTPFGKVMRISLLGRAACLAAIQRPCRSFKGNAFRKGALPFYCMQCMRCRTTKRLS